MKNLYGNQNLPLCLSFLLTMKKTETQKYHQPESNTQKLFQCEICKKTFNQKTHFITHKLTHIGLKPFKCDICDKDFNNCGNLFIHKKIHTGPRVKKYFKLNHLNIHM